MRGNGRTIHTPRTQGGMGLGGHMMRSPQGGLSAGKDRRKVVMCPCRGSDPDDGHPRAQNWGGVPRHRYGVSAGTHLAEGSCPHLCGSDTE